MRTPSSALRFPRPNVDPRPRRLSVFGALALSSLLAAVSVAQQAKPEQPRFLLTTAGPVAPVYAMAFSPDGSRLFSAGGDKMVHVWDVRRDRDGATRVDLSTRFFWNIARGGRGSIYAMTLSPDGNLLAIGGYSARSANGDIYILDSRTGDIVKVLGSVKGDDQHRTLVCSLGFSPNGRYLVSTSSDGEARVWDTKTWTSRVLSEPDDHLQLPRPAIFVSDTRVALPEQVGPRRWRIAIHDVRNPLEPPIGLSRIHAGWVMAMAYDNWSHNWVTADKDGHVYLWDDADIPGSKRLCDGTSTRAMSFGAPNRLVIAVLRRVDTPARLEFWDTERGHLLDSTETSNEIDNFACAASHDGQHIAAMRPDDSELHIWSTPPNSDSPTRPLSRGLVAKRKGAGSTVWNVAFGIRSNSLAIGHDKNDRTRWNRAFDFQEFKLTEPLEEYRDPHTGRAEWDIVPFPAGGTREVTLLRNGAEYSRITLDDEYQGKAISHCWLATGDDKPYGIAIGTAKEYGIYVYSLPKQRHDPCRLLRYYRDHGARVTTLSASHDGRFLASGSTDQTVKIWSLEGLPPADGDTTLSAWGAVFEPARDGEALLVTKTSKAGILESRGITQGAKIRRVQHQQGGKDIGETEPARMLQALIDTPLWQSVVLSFTDARAPERAQRVLITPAWEPLLTLFLDRENNWAAWTPEGYYASSAIGDEMFGWLVFQGTLDLPEFHPAARFRQELERPDIVRELLATGNLRDAMERAGENVQGDIRQRLNEIAHALPVIDIIDPRPDTRMASGVNFTISARVKYPDEASTARYQVNCFINSSAASELRRQREGAATVIYQWRGTPVSEHNRVKVVVADQYAGHATRFVDASVVVKADIEPAPFRVHLVSLSGNDYEDALTDLLGAEDTQRFAKCLRSAAGPYFRMGTEIALAEDRVTIAALEEALSTFRREIGTNVNDVIVFHAAGHGVEFESEYYFLPASPHIAYNSGGGDTIKQHGIPWRFIRRFGELPCRKIFLLDTCRLNINGRRFVGEEAARSSIRPLTQSGSLVITATQNGNLAWESIDRNGGIFTQSLVEALQGQADGYAVGVPHPLERDQQVDVDEVTGFLPERVRAIQLETLSRLQKQEFGQFLMLKQQGYGTQVPWISPSSIGDPLRLVRYADSK